MATRLKNLSQYNTEDIPDGSGMRFVIVVAEWNQEITFALRDGAINTLIKNGVSQENIQVEYVPGSFELSLGAQLVAETGKFAAVICLGCVIQGETRHFDFICHSVTQGITQLNIKYNLPVVFGVLTTDTQQQALDRAGGKHGNKGDEAAITAIKMAALKLKIKE
ncbi:MAG: 6,7-dimethyl-8-ribityllumazine synthase [Bacteroidales bacterium]|nr:6,7-dimethyl-8-ribityllumazine synthase [Bacteroidales bacterium]